MRTTKQCPKCQGEYIGMFPEVHVSVGHKEGEIALGGSFPVQAYTCASCGYFELYMQPLETWKHTPDEYNLVFTWLREPPSGSGPYR